MSVLRYGSVTFPFVYVNRFNLDAIYDESGTDRIYTRVGITATAVLNTAYLPIIGGLGTQLQNRQADLTNTIVDLRNYMLEPRRELSLTFNGTELIPQPAGIGGLVDAKNGPQPRSCQLIDLNNNTWFFQWSCEANYWENLKFAANNLANTNNTPGNNVISNRWSEIQTINNCNFSEIVRTGTYIIRSDNANGIIADDARQQMAIVGVPSNYLRQQSRYEVTPDGLSLRYTVQDQEVWKMPPSPAFTAKGTYVEDVNNGTNGIRHGECRVELKGDKSAPQVDLIKVAVATATAKLSMNGTRASKLIKGRVGLGLYDNEVDCTMTCLLTLNSKRLNGIAAFVGIDTTTPFSFPNYTPAYKLRGNVTGGGAGIAGPQVAGQGILLKAAAYYDPNLVGNKVNNTGQLAQGIQVGKAGTQIETDPATPSFAPDVPE